MGTKIDIKWNEKSQLLLGKLKKGVAHTLPIECFSQAYLLSGFNRRPEIKLPSIKKGVISLAEMKSFIPVVMNHT